MSKVNDELPERLSHDDLRAASAKHWEQPGGSTFSNGVPATPPVPAPLRSKPVNTAAPVPSQPGGERYSHAELASYSSRPDRNYRGAGNADLPAPGPLPRKIAPNSFHEGGE